MIALCLLFLIFAFIAVGVLAGLVLERKAAEDAARLSHNLPRQERRLSIQEQEKP